MSDEKTEETRSIKDTILVIAIILIIGVITFIVSYRHFLAGEEPKNPTITYNNFVFEQSADGFWNFQWKFKDRLYNVKLRYNPVDVEDVPMYGHLNESFKKPYVYITFNPTEKDLAYIALASAELSLSLAGPMHVYPIAACTQNKTDACRSRPIVTCKNATKPVIYLTTDSVEETEVIMRGNCIELRGRELELVRAVDRLLYVWYSIMGI